MVVLKFPMKEVSLASVISSCPEIPKYMFDDIDANISSSAIPELSVLEVSVMFANNIVTDIESNPGIKIIKFSKLRGLLSSPSPGISQNLGSNGYVVSLKTDRKRSYSSLGCSVIEANITIEESTDSFDKQNPEVIVSWIIEEKRPF